MCEMSVDNRKIFLSFVTGAYSLPASGFAGLQPALSVARKDEDGLPSVMTCAHYLKIPDYASPEVLKQKLYQAMEEGRGSFLLS